MSQELQARVARTIVLAGVLACVGCGGGPEIPELGYVTGKVTLDGSPLEGAVVAFQPEEGGGASTGQTDANGEFELRFNGDNLGAVIGRHTVSITKPTEAPDPSGNDSGGLPAKYNTQSELSEEVTADDNSFTFDLTSK